MTDAAPSFAPDHPDDPRFQEGLARVLADLDEAIYRVVIEADGSMTFGFLNEALVRLIGRASGPRQAGDLWLEHVHPEDLELARASMARGVEGESYDAEYRMVAADGGVRWVTVRHRAYREASGRIAGLGVVRDVTRRHEADVALAESEERFRSVVEQLPVIVWTTDRDGIVTMSEGRGLQTIGLSPGEAVGHQGLQAYGDAAAELHREALAGRDAIGIQQVHGRILESHYHPLRDDAGELRGVLGVSVDITERAQAQAEQAALRRVATAVAAGEDAATVFGQLADEVRQLLGVDAGAVVAVEVGADTDVLAARGLDAATARAVADAAWRRGSGPLAAQLLRREPVRLDEDAQGPTELAHLATAHRLGTLIGVPVRWRGRLWGLIVAGSRLGRSVPPEAADRMTRFAPLVALALANAEARRRLQQEATTDPLTGLANHRRFHEQLRIELRRALRHDRNLALALIDVDHFKDINDTLGHQRGDEVLRSIADVLAADRRAGELLARIGGDEFALIMPETDDAGAVAVADRLRDAVAAVRLGNDHQVTLSVGVADLAHAGDLDRLVRYADGALYWAKEHGRDVTWRYSADVEHALSDRERADRLARAQSLTALRSLARALDLRDPSTQRHSERVAELAVRLAVAEGWTPDRLRRLREAALLHDVGKIGTPDRILQKPARLTDEEYEHIKRHAELGAEIAGETLDAEQHAWIRHHHERWDGGGYPAGLAGDAIPMGAQIIAVADAFDVMTNARHYREPLPVTDALQECERHLGTQFCPAVVLALRQLYETGELPVAMRP